MVGGSRSGIVRNALKIILRIKYKVLEIIAQPWRRLPCNFAVEVYVSHRISGRFEFSQHFCNNPVTSRVDAVTPEAGGFESLIGVFGENSDP